MLHGQARTKFEQRLTGPIDQLIQNGSSGWVGNRAVHVHKASLRRVPPSMSEFIICKHVLACQRSTSPRSDERRVKAGFGRRLRFWPRVAPRLIADSKILDVEHWGSDGPGTEDSVRMKRRSKGSPPRAAERERR